MASRNDLRRLVNGVSLIAKELANRSESIQIAKSGDLETLISSSVKKSVVSITDLVGFTKGKIQEISRPRLKENVVYFTDSSQKPETNSEPNKAENAKSCLNVEEEVRDLKVEIQKIEDIVLDSETSADAIHENVGGFRSLREEGKIEERIPENVGGFKKLREEDEVVQGRPENVLVKETDERREVVVTPAKQRKLRERRVPATPFTRALGFAGLGAGLAWGTIQESAKRLVYGTPQSQDKESAISPFLSEQNAERLALALCRMRGAALKLGQMLSIQDESLVPAPILAALDIVRQGADVMPSSQLNQVLDAELGPGWTSKLQSFDYEPMAAASIGQVHRAVTKDGQRVAMKIQYPGVADSIESDLENVKLLLNYTNLIPKGLYLDSAMKVAKQELSQECNYELEAASQKRFRDLLSEKEEFYVPIVIEDISSKRVITTEFVSGVAIDKVAGMSQKTRDYVGKKLLELTLMELFVFRFMQTDPNWSNFLYDEVTNKINLIDFGAARGYPKNFVDDYLRMVLACANCDSDAVIEMSQRLGFLTGMEPEVMLDAHVQAGFVVGLPFARPGGYDFRRTNITQSVSNLGATMLRHRLTPPPDEAYSLHRKLSGAFLACIKLGAVVPCRELLLEVYEKYQFGNEGVVVQASN